MDAREEDEEPLSARLLRKIALLEGRSGRPPAIPAARAADAATPAKPTATAPVARADAAAKTTTPSTCSLTTQGAKGKKPTLTTEDAVTAAESLHKLAQPAKHVYLFDNLPETVLSKREMRKFEWVLREEDKERKRLQRLQKQKDKGRHQPNDNDDETEDAFDNKWTAGGLQAGVVPKAAVPAASAAAVSSSAAAVSSSAAAVSSSAAASKQLMSLDFLCSDDDAVVPSPKLADQPSRVPSPALLPASSSLFATKPLSAEVVHDDADYVTLPRTFSVGKTIQVQERNGEWFRAAILSIEDRLMFVHFDNSDSGHDQWIEYDEKTMKIASSSGGNKASASSRKDPKPSPAQEPGRDARHFVTRSLMKQLAEKPAPAKKKNTKLRKLADSSDEEGPKIVPAERQPQQPQLPAQQHSDSSSDDDGDSDGSAGSDAYNSDDGEDDAALKGGRRTSVAGEPAKAPKRKRTATERLRSEKHLSGKQLRRLLRQQRKEEEIELRKQQQAELDASAWFKCDNCQHGIHTQRYSCQYCETDEEGMNSFDLCVSCFQVNFPYSHPHPRESFALEVIEEDLDLNTDDHEEPNAAATIKGRSLQPDTFLPNWESLKPPQNEFEMLLEERREHYCELCDEGDGDAFGPFVSDIPFAVPGTRSGVPQSYFWIHRACALAAPEVVCRENNWFNVAKAVRRGKRIKCTSCNKKGATVGCYDITCNKSFHVRCSGRPAQKFLDGVVYWCAQHDMTRTKVTYEYIINCDGCGQELKDSWRSCTMCESYWNGFDLCLDCFDRVEMGVDHKKKRPVVVAKVPPPPPPAVPSSSLDGLSLTGDADSAYGTSPNRSPSPLSDCMDGVTPAASSPPAPPKEPLLHPHERDKFKIATREAFDADSTEDTEMKKISRSRTRRPRPVEGSSARQCYYCSTSESTEWRQGFHGVIMCTTCAAVSEHDNPDAAMDEDQDSVLQSIPEENDYIASVEDYAHQPYETRRLFTNTTSKLNEMAADTRRPLFLPTYAPQQDQLYSLNIKTTFFDVPGRAPRWASHSSSDYSGTWLPQIVRWTLERLTNEGDRVLTNFLGRGTDVIEAFLLGRKAVGIDINPMAVALSQRNCTFAVPPELQQVMRADRRPTLILANAMRLQGALFRNASYDHVLSHPPYFRCIVYSSHLDEDISRSPDFQKFGEQMSMVAKETRRVLKPGKYCTLGIGDNREHCFVIPVSFVTINAYIQQGLQLSELIVKRQRCCSGTAKGASLSILHDFLIITHEFIAIFRNPDGAQPMPCECGDLPRQHLNTPISQAGPQQEVCDADSGAVKISNQTVPPSSFANQCKVLGTVWCYPTLSEKQLVESTCNQVLGRFGSPGQRWRRVRWAEDEQPEEGVSDEEQPEDRGDLQQPRTETTSDPTTDEATNEAPKLSDYEIEKNRRVENNNRLLQALGLLSTDESMAGHSTFDGNIDESLKKALACLEESNREDISVSSFSSASSKAYAPSPVALAFIDPKRVGNVAQVDPWRRHVLTQCLQAARSLTLGGVLVVGARDQRFECACCKCKVLWPLSIILWRDLEEPLADAGLVLKEIVGVAPQQFSKSKNDVYEPTTSQTGRSAVEVEHLPIVHDLYLIYVKKSNKSN